MFSARSSTRSTRDLGSDDVVLTVATDGADMYETEMALTESKRFGGRFDETLAAEVFGRWLLGTATDHVIELDRRGRERIFNLGYYTWVEQQNVSLEDFDARRDPRYWDGLMQMVGDLGRYDRGFQSLIAARRNDEAYREERSAIDFHVPARDNTTRS